MSEQARSPALEVAQKAVAVAEQALDLAEACAALEYDLAPDPSLTSSPRTLRDLCTTMRDRVSRLPGASPPSSADASLASYC